MHRISKGSRVSVAALAAVGVLAFSGFGVALANSAHVRSASHSHEGRSAAGPFGGKGETGHATEGGAHGKADASHRRSTHDRDRADDRRQDREDDKRISDERDKDQDRKYERRGDFARERDAKAPDEGGKDKDRSDERRGDRDHDRDASREHPADRDRDAKASDEGGKDKNRSDERREDSDHERDVSRERHADRNRDIEAPDEGRKDRDRDRWDARDDGRDRDRDKDPLPPPPVIRTDEASSSGGAAPASASPASAPAPAHPAGGRSRGGGGAPSVTLPPPGETRFVADQVVIFSSGALTPEAVADILKRNRLTQIESTEIALIDRTLRIWHIADGRSVAEVETGLASENGLGAVQPNFVYGLADEAAPSPPPGLYALDNLRVEPALDLVGGARVKVALIDTAVDGRHPDLAGAVAESFDAIGSGAPHSLAHGTAMAGAIVGHGQVRGVAPSVELLSARAFDSDGAGGALGNSATIMKAIDWSVRSGAAVINMSFAGPKDPSLHAALATAVRRGVAAVGAMGNAGPHSPPLYPGADENVIAITATDADNKPYADANVGAYVAAAAPGVDVLLPTQENGYSLETGTSVSAALASGVVALALERQPKATVTQIRNWLVGSARPIGADKAHVGAGLIDAEAMVKAAKP